MNDPHQPGQSLEADIDRVLADVKRGTVTDGPPFVPTPAPNISERIDAEIAAWNAARQEPTTMNQHLTDHAQAVEIDLLRQSVLDIARSLTGLIHLVERDQRETAPPPRLELLRELRTTAEEAAERIDPQGDAG